MLKDLVPLEIKLYIHTIPQTPHKKSSDANTISITWDVNAESVYDNMRWEELVHLNSHGWAKNYIAEGV